MIKDGLETMANQGFRDQMCQTFHFGLLHITSKEEGCEPSLRGIFHNLVVKLLSFPVGMFGRPNRETATAHLRASGVWLQGSFGVWLMLAGRRGVTSATASAPVFLHLLVLAFCIAPPPFPEAFTAYGMATVLPPVVAVKR